MLVKKELIAQIRKTRDGDGRWRKDVRLLSDKVLPPIILAHRKARNIGAYWRKRIEWRGELIVRDRLAGVIIEELPFGVEVSVFIDAQAVGKLVGRGTQLR